MLEDTVTFGSRLGLVARARGGRGIRRGGAADARRRRDGAARRAERGAGQRAPVARDRARAISRGVRAPSEEPPRVLARDGRRASERHVVGRARHAAAARVVRAPAPNSPVSDDPSPRNIHVAAAAATRLHGITRRYACEAFHAAWGGPQKGVAPLCGQNDAFQKTLRFSAQLAQNVEWCDEAAPDAVDALEELRAAAAAAAFPFELRSGDVVALDATRWLFAYRRPSGNLVRWC